MLSRSGSSSISSGSSSFGVQSSTPPSLPPKPKSNGVYEDTYEYAYATSTGPQTISSHSGPSSTHHLSSTPPPPINLSTHPSRRKHQRCLSNPGDMAPQPTSLSKQQKSGSKDSGFNTNTSSFEALNFDEDFQNINESMSNLISELSSESGSASKQDQQSVTSDLDEMITMLQDLGTEETDGSTATSEVPPPLVRTLSLPGGSNRTKHKRANSTSTCQPTHYLKHRLQKTPQPPMAEQPEEYVFMQPIQKAPEPAKSALPPSCRQNYDQLSTIEERSLGPASDYENYPLPEDVAKATPVIFQPTYENFGSSMKPDTPSETRHDNPQQPDTAQTDTAPTASSKNCDLAASVWDELQNLENVLAGLTAQD